MTLTINSILAPGVYVSTDVAGFIPAAIASFSTTYLVGTSESGTADTPTQVVSVEDFANQFGEDSPSEKYVRLYFRNNPRGVLYFVKVDEAVPGTPTAAEFVATIGAAFEPEMAQGFLIAPEAFESFATQADRTSVAVAMENLCATEGFDWMALVDAGAPDVIATHADAVTEGQLYTTAAGHLAYYFPYLVDLEDEDVAPSAAIAGLSIRRYREQGFYQPGAGTKYPIRGVKEVKVKVLSSQQETSNPLGINVIRNLPQKGIVAWGARTRSSNEYWRFINTRIVFNVLNGTLKYAFDDEIFSAVDGLGILFMRLKQTAEAICYEFWKGKALYGASAQEAYQVVISAENNSDLALESGAVRLDIYAAPAPTMERLLIRTVRVPINQVQAVVNQEIDIDN